MPKVSVIVPVYNAERYLTQCLDSIVKQTLRDIEIIIVNDGSTDGSPAICRRYLSDDRVIYIEKQNEGAAAARQDGLDRSSGEYLTFVDADDWLEPDMYERMFLTAKENDADIVFCNCIKNEDDRRYPPAIRSGFYDRRQIIEDILPYSLAYIGAKGERKNIRWVLWLRLFKSEMIKQHHIRYDPRFRRSQDLQFTYEATLAARRYYYLGDAYLYHHRIVDDSLSRGYNKNLWQLYVPLIERLYQDTEAFKEADLMPQMHLRAFFFTIESILNEVKPSFPYSDEKRTELITEIITHPLCRRYYGKIETEKLDTSNRAYYQMIFDTDVEGLIRLAQQQTLKTAKNNSRYEQTVELLKRLPVINHIYRFYHHRREEKRLSTPVNRVKS